VAAGLDREIEAEETRSGNSDPTQFAYSTYAKAARQRRDNLKHSIAGLKQQLDAARKTLADAVEEFELAVPADRRTPRPGASGGIDRAREAAGLILNRAS
jgi:hypothetical protein